MTKRALLLLPIALAACSTEREPPPQPAPRPQARPAPVPVPPAPTPAPTGWADLPLTPGGWTYGLIVGLPNARFAASGVQDGQFILRCDPQPRVVRLLRAGNGATARTMTVRTSFGARTLPLVEMNGPGEYVGAELASADPFLDNMAFSRGRVSIEVAGMPMLVMPAWAEPARVVEDCRKMGS